VRRIGERTLPLIANEVYLAILDHLEPYDGTDPAQRAEHKAVLSNLALVCRFFCAECLPRIFRSMEYSGTVHRTSTPSYAKFCRGLVTGDETASYLGQYVKECSVTHWIRAVEKGQWVFVNFLKVYMKSISRLVNLETLNLHNTPLDLKFLVALRALEKLESLSIIDCDFQCLKADELSCTESLKLIRFSLFGHRDNGMLATLSRIVSSTFLRILKTDNWTFLKAFMGQRLDFGIEFLTIPISMAEIILLRNFLANSPTITSITLSIIQFDRSYNQLLCPPIDLPLSSLPLLSQLQCPACLIPDLVPGRPLHSIKIDSQTSIGSKALDDEGQNEKRILSVLQRSTAHITTLQVPGFLFATVSFDRIFPKLQTLILDISWNADVVLPEVKFFDNDRCVITQCPDFTYRLSSRYAPNGQIHRPFIVCISMSRERRRGILISHFNSLWCPGSLGSFQQSCIYVSQRKWNGEGIIFRMKCGCPSF
jgi:hypothetical protein